MSMYDPDDDDYIPSENSLSDREMFTIALAIVIFFAFVTGLLLL